MFDDIISEVISSQNQCHIVTLVDNSYYSDTISGLIPAEDFEAFYSYDYYIHFDKKNKIMRLGLKSIWNFIRQIYEALPIINYILWGEKSILVHASAIVIDSHAFLLLGESGAGKTTFSKLAYDKDIKILSDEIVAIQFDNSPVIWGTHVHSDDYCYWPNNIVDRAFPLAFCFLLKKSTQSKIFPAENIDKVSFFNKYIKKYVYKIYSIESILSMILNLEFCYLEFEKEKFNFDLFDFWTSGTKYHESLFQIINNNISLYAEAKLSLEDPNTKNIQIIEVKKNNLYFVKLRKKNNKYKWESKFLIGKYNYIDYIDSQSLSHYLPDECSFISYAQIDNIQYTGRKKLFSLSNYDHSIKNNVNNYYIIRQITSTEPIDCITEILNNSNTKTCPDHEQYIKNQIKCLTADLIESHDFWGVFNDGLLISLVRIDHDIVNSNTIVRSIGLIFTKEEYRNKGVAFSLVSSVIDKYDHKTIWRYEAEEENIPSCNLAQKLGFIYEGDTFFYEYHKKSISSGDY